MDRTLKNSAKLEKIDDKLGEKEDLSAVDLLQEVLAKVNQMELRLNKLDQIEADISSIKTDLSRLDSIDQNLAVVLTEVDKID